MPSLDRETSRDSVEERNLIQRNSASFDHGRALTIPMWDSSDPERAPPPLPLNPTSPKVTVNRSNTSRAIQTAHAALTEKARESAYPISPYPKRIEGSPERPTSKGSGHKRMQSSVKDLSSLIEGGNILSSSPKSPEKYTSPEKPHSPEKYSRPSTPRFSRDFLLEAPPEKNTSRQSTPAPSNRDSTREPNTDVNRDSIRDSNRDPSRDPKRENGTESPSPALAPAMRPSLRKPPHQQSILGENAPPQSATMLALQSMPTRETENPLSNVTNGSTALVRTGNFDAISNQILSLTSICTSLQKEMSNLSRRSKDNATDLVSLKEATNSRDEDIRKSLRELVSNLSETSTRAPSSLPGSGSLYLDNKPHMSSSPGSKSMKQFTLPRIPSPSSFSASLDRGMSQSPTVFGPESAASIALLEKILREMGTKEGQDLLVSRLTEVAERLARDGLSTSKKLEDLVQFIKENTESSQALIARGNGAIRDRSLGFNEAPRLDLDFDRAVPGPLIPRNRDKENKEPGGRASDFVNDELFKIIRNIKDMVAHGGGVTAEVKALVRELRGEVLGMGREIGRKLDEAETRNRDSANETTQSHEEINQIVQTGLGELKQHMDRVLQENLQQSLSSQITKAPVDGQEVFNAVRSAMVELQAIQNASAEPQVPGLEKEDVIEAVRVAWENYKPDIELQHFGLERDELLVCLKEGIQEFMPQDEPRGATRDEVFKAVVEGFKHFVPPKVETEATLSREEILDAVRDCLEEFEFPSAPPIPREDEITRDDMVAAVREGLSTFDFPVPEVSQALSTPAIQRDDVFEAVKIGLNSHPALNGRVEEHISDRLRDVLGAIRVEFQAVSEEAKQNVAAHGRDTEQLLDANRDGLERLRADIESYVDRAADVTGKDEILENLRLSFSNLSEQIEILTSREPENSMDAVRGEFEHLQQTMATALVRGSPTADKDEIIEVVREGIESLRADIDRPRESHHQSVANKDEIIEVVRDGIETLRTDFDRPRDLNEIIASKEEVIEVVREGIESLRADIDRPRDSNDTIANKDEIIEFVREGIESLRADIDRPRDSNESVLSGTGEILDALHDGLTGLRSDVEKLANKPVEPIDMTLNYEILDTLKAGLESLRVDMDRLRVTRSDDEDRNVDRSIAAINNGAVIAAIPQIPESLKRNDIENLEVLITQLRIKVEAMEAMPPPEPQPSASLAREDLAEVEELIRNVHASVIDIQERETTADELIRNVHASVIGIQERETAADELIRNVHASVTNIQERETAADEDTIKKEDVVAIETLLRNTKAKIDEIDTEHAVKKEDLDAVEVLLRETHAGVGELVSQIEDVSRKEDVVQIESLLKELFSGLEEVKEKIAEEANNGEKVSKTDVEAVEAVVLDVKTQIEQMVLTDLATLASKEDVTNLGEIVKEFKERIEVHAQSNATSFEERQAETVGVGERVSEVQLFLKEFHGLMRERLDEGATNVEALGKFLEGMGETISQNATMTDDIKEVFETMKAEFEKSNAGVVGAKLESDDQFLKTRVKIDEKFEEKFSELAAKLDEAQVVAEERAKSSEEKSTEIEATMSSTKAVAEELKLFIDSLGATLVESVEKMDEASKTVFSRVEDTLNKVGEVHDEAKAEHELTRQEVSKSLTAIEGVSGHVTEYHPKILESLKDVLEIVGQHYEHSKTSTTAISMKIDEIPPPPEPPLLPEPPKIEKYDDTEVHEKLNNLVEHMQNATKSFSQLEMLDQIHQKVISTAAEVSAFLNIQTKLITEGHEDKQREIEDQQREVEGKQREVEAATIALEKRLTQKDHVEAEIVGLREEEDRIRESIKVLRAEQESITQQKMFLSATVSSLETTLSIRREELHSMDARAEVLERRVLESMMNHSRSLLLSKSQKPTKESMNLKRVPSHASAQNGRSTSHAASNVGSEMSGVSRSTYSSVSQSAISIAMSSGSRSTNQTTPSNSLIGSNNPANTSRRISSLNQITNNALNNLNSSAPGFKRSHSVRAPPTAGIRKTSWGGSGTISKRGAGMDAAAIELNKENLAVVGGGDGEGGSVGASSDAGTTRRLSTGVIEEGDEEEDEEEDDDDDEENSSDSMFSETEDEGSSVQGAGVEGGELTLYTGEGEQVD